MNRFVAATAAAAHRWLVVDGRGAVPARKRHCRSHQRHTEEQEARSAHRQRHADVVPALPCGEAIALRFVVARRRGRAVSREVSGSGKCEATGLACWQEALHNVLAACYCALPHSKVGRCLWYDMGSFGDVDGPVTQPRGTQPAARGGTCCTRPHEPSSYTYLWRRNASGHRAVREAASCTV